MSDLLLLKLPETMFYFSFIFFHILFMVCVVTANSELETCTVLNSSVRKAANLQSGGWVVQQHCSN